jgi:hypothetical protein
LELTRDLDLTTDVQYAAKKKADLDIRMTNTAPAAPDEVDHMVNIFGGGNRGGVWDVPEEIRMINIFGGANLDFTDARFAARTTRITVFCLFGGANFYVPDGMRTVSKALCVFGGVNNRAPSTSAADAPTLLISGLTLFGGVNIRVKKSVKQRLYEFANALRTLFGTREPPRI